MVKCMRLRNILSFVFLTLCPAALAAAPAPLEGEFTYRFTWNGIPFGYCTLRAEAKGNDFRLHSSIEATGVARIATSHKSVSTLEGSGKAYLNAERVYETHYSTRNKQKYVRLAYGADGALTETVAEPPEPEGKRPAVPLAQLKGVPDPLTYIFALRATLANVYAKGEKEASVLMYDGRRLYSTGWAFAGERFYKPEKGASIPAIAFTGTRTPIAGFTEKEKSKMTDDPALTLVFAKGDNSWMPLELSLPLLGTIKATLEH